MEDLSAEFIFSLVGLLAGIISMIFLLGTLRKGPEALRGAVAQFVIGILLITLAFLWDVLFTLGSPGLIFPFDIHHLFMAASILFFVNAARKFYHFAR